MNVLPACRFVHPCPAMPRRSEEGLGFPWNWSSPGIGVNRRVSAAMWVVGMEPGCSARAVGALNHLAIFSPAPLKYFLKARRGGSCLYS